MSQETSIQDAFSRSIAAYRGVLHWVECGAMWAPLNIDLQIEGDKKGIQVEFHSDGDYKDDRDGAYKGKQRARRLYLQDPDAFVFETGPFFPTSSAQLRQRAWLRFELKEVRDARGWPFCFVEAFWRYSDQTDTKCIGLLQGHRIRSQK